MVGVHHILVYLYDAQDSPIGMGYRNSTYSSGTVNTYWFEKNLQGDIIAIYNEGGTKLVSYTYDAWGKPTASTPTYHNGGESTAVQYNPFRYRGYYYDSELGFYYLNSRYYDPETGRFISADTLMSGVDGSVQGKNLFDYCFNNPINLNDSNGNWPKWIKKVASWTKDNILKPVAEFIIRCEKARYESIEAQFGGGFGLGGGVDGCGSTEFYHDLYLGVDDGEFIAGREIAGEAKFQGFGFGTSYNHWSERGDEFYFCKDCMDDFGIFKMMFCDHSEASASQSFLGVFTINDDGELLIGIGVSAHTVIGGHARINFNVSEYLERVFGK